MRTLTGVGWRGAVWGAVLLALLPAVSETTGAQCAMCRTAFASEEGQRLVTAFQSGILFLLAAPFVTFGTVAFLAVRALRVSRSRPHEAEQMYRGKDRSAESDDPHRMAHDRLRSDQ